METIKEILRFCNMIFLGLFAISFAIAYYNLNKVTVELRERTAERDRLTATVEGLTEYTGELEDVIRSNTAVYIKQLGEAEEICRIAKSEIIKRRGWANKTSALQTSSSEQTPREGLGGTLAGGNNNSSPLVNNEVVSDETSYSVVCFVNGVFGVWGEDGSCR